jgi:hypothetical protein
MVFSLIMGIEKSFDVLIIESPSEYYGHMALKEDSLKQLGNFCRRNNIPVRVPNGNQGFSRLPDGVGQDSIIKECFEGCNYRDSLDLNELSLLGNNENIKILFTGGLFCYAIPSHFNAVLEYEPDLDLNQIINLNSSDSSRNIFIPGGCVPGRSAEIYQKLFQIGKHPIHYIDGKSSYGFHHIDPDSVFVVSKVGEFPSGIKYSITTKLPRSIIIPD